MRVCEVSAYLKRVCQLRVKTKNVDKKITQNLYFLKYEKILVKKKKDNFIINVS